MKTGKIGLIEFLNTETDKDKLSNALEVIREYKSNESMREWMAISFEAWKMLEELEEMLDFLVNGTEINERIKEVYERLKAGKLEHLREDKLIR